MIFNIRSVPAPPKIMPRAIEVHAMAGESANWKIPSMNRYAPATAKIINITTSGITGREKLIIPNVFKTGTPPRTIRITPTMELMIDLGPSNMLSVSRFLSI